MEIALINSNPDVVSKITNDEIFYGKEFNQFVRTQLTIDKKKKEKIRLEMEANFINLNYLYEEFREKTK